MKTELFFYFMQKKMNIQQPINFEDYSDFFSVVTNKSLVYDSNLLWCTYNYIRSVGYLVKLSHNKSISKCKYKCLRELMSNCFYSQTIKDQCINIIGETTRALLNLYKFMRIYKLKDKPKIDIDFNLKTINQKDKNVITIRENNCNYLFTLPDLLNIINKSLSRCDHFFVASTFPKNPYTNLPFSLSTLYNVYFKLKVSDLPFSVLFHEFYKCNFNLELFKINHELVVREESFKNFLKFGLASEQEKEIHYMLKSNFWTKKWVINKSFPQNTLIEIFKPLLKLYLDVAYGSRDHEKYFLHKKKLHIYLKKMYSYNVCFGRKNVHIKAKETSYNTKHLTFKELESVYSNIVYFDNSYFNYSTAEINNILQIVNNSFDQSYETIINNDDNDNNDDEDDYEYDDDDDDDNNDDDDDDDTDESSSNDAPVDPEEDIEPKESDEEDHHEDEYIGISALYDITF